MTGKPSGQPDPESTAQRWLEHRLGRLVDGLNGVLDLDAGLHEIRTRQQHEALDRDVRRMLDLDAGLHEILSTPTLPPPAPPAGVIAASETTRTESLTRILAARTDPAVRDLLRLIAGARAGTTALTRVNTFYLANGLVLAMGHPHMHALALADADDVVDDRAVADALGNGHTLAFADALAADDHRALADALDRVRAFAVALGDPRVEGGARELAGDPTRVLAVADALFGIIDRVLTRRLARLLAGVDVANLTSGQAAGLLDDFTQADLRRVDLTGVDLTGLRWSAATRWPSPGFAEQVKARSRETGPGSGVFEVVGAEGSTLPEVVPM